MIFCIHVLVVVSALCLAYVISCGVFSAILKVEPHLPCLFIL